MATAAFTFDAEKHLYTRADGLRAPSVTQVLKRTGWISFDNVPEDVLERASKRGTDVHAITEFLDTEFAGVAESDIDLTPIAPEYLPYVQAWLKFKRECDVEILDCEQQSIAEINGMPYGLKYDCRAIVNGRESILEKKTCAAMSKHWGLQLSAYDLGVGQCPTQLRRDRYAVQLRANGDYRLWPFENLADYNAFLSSLQTCWEQLNRNYRLD